MSSNFNNDLRLELIGTGDQPGVWGETTNINLGTLLVDAIAGYTSISTSAEKYALTANNGVADESRNATLAISTTHGAAYEVYVPPTPKLYVIYNADVAQSLTVYNSTALGDTTAAGTGVTIPAGTIMTLWTDGTDFNPQNTYVNATAPTAASKTSTGQIATTAFADRLRGFLTNTTTTGTVALSDRGCLLAISQAITIPANVFALNDAFTVYNNSGSPITITQGSGLTMYWAGPSTSGTRTLAGRGLCTIVFITATTCVMSGAGVS